MENDKAILEGLNIEQKKAVESIQGPVLIVAGAGSGKTKVLTSRIAYILSGGGEPSRILALTFTKKAANEMKERISILVGYTRARRLCMGTFHSVFIRFLRDYSDSIGYPVNFTIYDTGDSTSAIKTCIKELGLDEKIYKPKDVLSRISMAKNNLITVSAYVGDPRIMQEDAAKRKPRIADIYRLYQQKCRQSGVMDFDDILLNMNILLRDNPQALEEISSRFDYIMVDEYQDTNYAQYLIIKKLSQKHRNICVVGDDSQSIYAFRGARIENILNFQKDYPENKTFRLEQNYRSTQVIVNAANSLIDKNVGRIPKKCFSQGECGEKIRLMQVFTEQDEAQQVVSNIISRILEERAEYQDFAILYRTNAQSRALEEALRKRNLPYMIYSGKSFYDRLEVKDLMAYFKLAVNRNDDESFKRIVNKPTRGIGDTSLAAVTAAAHNMGCPLMQAAVEGDLAAYGLKSAAIGRIRAFTDMIASLSLRAAHEDAHSVAVSIAVESGLFAHYKSDSSVEGQAKAANVEELLNSVKVYVEERNESDFNDLVADGQVEEGAEITGEDLPPVTLSDYLENVSLLSAVEVEEGEDATNRIALMTVHSSKGLEFPYVFITGLEENLFPSGGWLATDAEMEEERRLFYVALTRAKKMVWLSFATERMRNGKRESNSPSRFISEIDREYIANPLPERGGQGFSCDDDVPESLRPLMARRMRIYGNVRLPDNPASIGPSPGRPGLRPVSSLRSAGAGSGYSRPTGGALDYSGAGGAGSSVLRPVASSDVGVSSATSGVGVGGGSGSSAGGGIGSGSSAGGGIGSGSSAGGGIGSGSSAGGGIGSGSSAGGGIGSGSSAGGGIGSGSSAGGGIGSGSSAGGGSAPQQSGFRPGQKVIHNKFGEGIIESVSGLPQDRAVINFTRFGKKTLLLQYAKLRIVGE